MRSDEWTVPTDMSKPSYWRIAEKKEIHITQMMDDRYAHMECGRVEERSWHLTKCFRPNSLDAICRGCRSGW